MDDAAAPPAPEPPPGCEWEQFCRELPSLRQQMEELAEAQRQLTDQVALMNQRDSLMAHGIAELSIRQRVTAADELLMKKQLKQVLDGITALTGTPSNFSGLAQDVRGSFNLTRRFVKWVLLPLGTVAAAVAAIWGMFHLTGNAEELPAPTEQPAPRGDG